MASHGVLNKLFGKGSKLHIALTGKKSIGSGLTIDLPKDLSRVERMRALRRLDEERKRKRNKK